MNLAIEDSEPLKSQARRLAVQDAKNKVAEIADELGIGLGAIVSIQDQHTSSIGGFVQTARTATPMSASANVPIEAGSVSAWCVVTLTYAIAGS